MAKNLDFSSDESPREFCFRSSNPDAQAMGNSGLYNPNFWFVQSKNGTGNGNLAGACHFYVP